MQCTCITKVSFSLLYFPLPPFDCALFGLSLCDECLPSTIARGSPGRTYLSYSTRALFRGQHFLLRNIHNWWDVENEINTGHDVCPIYLFLGNFCAGFHCSPGAWVSWKFYQKYSFIIIIQMLFSLVQGCLSKIQGIAK